MNTWISWKTDKIIFLILLGLLLISHIPFLNADPDKKMSVGRGPFTDEGLNTVQVRNWINQGTLSLSECDNLLKTPMLGFPLALTYFVFGTSHLVSRLHVLLLLLMALFIVGSDKKNRMWTIIFLPVSMLQYHLFHSSHYSMGEMLSVGAIILAIHYLAKAFDMSVDEKSRKASALLSGTFLSLSYFIKIQFIYLIVLLPVIMVIYWFASNYFVRRQISKQGLAVIGSLLFFVVLYFLGWYLPNRTWYDYMMAHQSGEFSPANRLWEFIRFNLGYHFMHGWAQWFIYVFILMTITGFILVKKKGPGRFPVMYIASLTWFMLELHKLAMAYLPTRYQVSLYASMGMVISLVIAELWHAYHGRMRIIARTASLVIVVSLTVFNFYNYFFSLTHRSFVIRDTNKYLAAHIDRSDLVLGTWAPCLTWDAKAKAIPVWNHFLNYQDPITTFHPKAIISEPDEQESEQAYKSQGINLVSISDSSRVVKIGDWEVEIFWVGNSE